MRCSENFFDVLTPSASDGNNLSIREIFQTIVLERNFDDAVTKFEITIEARADRGARILCETYRSDELQDKRSVEFPTLDAAVVEAGRLAHNKMRSGFHYRLVSAVTGYRDTLRAAIA